MKPVARDRPTPGLPPTLMIEHAQQLARALDAEDYDAALALLAPDCVYDLRGTRIRGARAIVESYRKNADAARCRFDRITYESTVTETGEMTATIEYVDIVTLASRIHRHRCIQNITMNEDGLVSCIRHVDIKGESEALRRFEAAHSQAPASGRAQPGSGEASRT